MIEHDTIELMRESDAGIRMGISAIDEICKSLQDGGFKDMLNGYRAEYVALQNEIEGVLHSYREEGKEPNPMAKAASWLKTGFAMAANGTAAAAADIITDGCNMGIKSLNKYLNQYKAADERAQNFARRLIELQQKQLKELAAYL